MENKATVTLSRSVLECRCPRCRQGRLFISPRHYNLNRMLDMPEQCAVCGQQFEIEPGFWLGALWVSYPIVIFIIIATTALSYVVFHFGLFGSFLTAAFLLLILFPPLIRISRSAYIHLFVSYRAK